jgi:hypothetical protein
MSNDLANLEALLNIAANLGEIVGIGAGIRLFIGSAVMLARKYGRAKQFAIGGLIVVSTGLALPGLVNILVSINVFLALVVAWATALSLVVFAWHTWWLPCTIATKADGKGHPVMFFFCLISGYLAPAWFICLYLATRDKTEESFAAASAVPPVLGQIFARITNRTGKQTLGCGQVHLATAEEELK